MYEGEWSNNKRHGKGVYKYPDGNTYEGDWEHGKKQGEGALDRMAIAMREVGRMV